ncbi:MAG: TatD family hydrolase [Clostridiales Family XIII bacterium]|jgi:TatD DNase family protein|nr:TatD family hydrolase [Clostridiales Family XIII bacterium]
MEKILFDSHTHINAEGYTEEERTALKERIEASAVAYAVDVGFDLESSRIAARNAAERSWCFAAVGVHPHDADTLTDEALAELRILLGGHDADSGGGHGTDGDKIGNHGASGGGLGGKIVAVGEIGLDYYRDLSPRDVQQDAFRRQIRLALEAEVPMTIHDRDSAGDTIRILKEEGAFGAERKAAFPVNPVTGIPDARVLLHCFSGSAQQALEYIDLGCTISIAGPVTYKSNKKTVLVAGEIPLAHMLIETDAPYLTPEPLRGTPNESPNVEYVCRKIADIRGASYEEIADATRENGLRFFGIAALGQTFRCRNHNRQ